MDMTMNDILTTSDLPALPRTSCPHHPHTSAARTCTYQTITPTIIPSRASISHSIEVLLCERPGNALDIAMHDGWRLAGAGEVVRRGYLFEFFRERDVSFRSFFVD